MKKLLIWAVCAMAVMISCKNKGQTGAVEGVDSLVVDSVLDEVQDTTPPPLFLYYLSPDYMMFVYWTGFEEPDKAEYEKNEAMEWFEENHLAWAIQERARFRANQYSKLLLSDGQTVDVKYSGEQLKDPNGKEMYPGELHGRPTIPSPGLQYALVNPADAEKYKEQLGGMHLLVTESYLKTRKPLSCELLSPYDAEKPFPAPVIQQLEKEYGMKVQRSVQSQKFGDRYVYGVVQFKGEYKKPGVKPDSQGYERKYALALEVITDGDKIYSFPVEGGYDDQYGPTWNADDEGQYIESSLVAFEGPNGPEFAYWHGAPESLTVGMYYIRNEKLIQQQYACYHTLIDENTPLWEKDLAQMRKLYLEADAQENKDYNLTRYRTIDIDEDGVEEFWLRDKDDKHGAIFTMKDGKISLVGVENGRLQVSFRRATGGKGYVVISGSAGGPSMHTEVYELKNSEVVHRFWALEIYGEIDECTVNGKEATKEEGEAYLKSLPEAYEPYKYFTPIGEEE
ncbi:MAG: hypothetical protein IJ067_01790 [Prevotella sp.]|nr:hypothetical protein [Prevotella sp.]